MAKNGDSGSGGGGGPTGGTSGQSLNHGPGSFAHNNADQLPGGPTKAQETAPDLKAAFDQNRDPLIARQIADQGKTEAERRQAQQTRSRQQAFKASRARHAPNQAPVLRPDLPHGADVDRGTFNARQRQEHRQAVSANQSALPARSGLAAEEEPIDRKQTFRLSRGFQGAAAPGPVKSPSRGR